MATKTCGECSLPVVPSCQCAEHLRICEEQQRAERAEAEVKRLKGAARDVLGRYGRRDPATQLPPAPGKTPQRIPALENLDRLVAKS